MVRMLAIAYCAAFAAITLAKTKHGAPSVYSSSSPFHRREVERIDGRLKNLTVLPRSDTIHAQPNENDPDLDPCNVYEPQRQGPWTVSDYADYGKELYDAWEAQPEDADQPTDWSIPSNFDVVAERYKPRTPPNVGKKAKRPKTEELPNRSWTRYQLVWPKPSLELPPEGRATFIGEISVEEGVFYANDIDRGDMPQQWDFSEIAWYMWWLAVERENNEHDGVDYEYSRLRRYIVFTLNKEDSRDWVKDDRITNGICKVVFDTDIGGSGLIRNFRPHDEDVDRNPFYALLGSPSIAPIMSMLTERKKYFKGNGIVNIDVTKFREPGRSWSNYVIQVEIGPSSGSS